MQDLSYPQFSLELPALPIKSIVGRIDAQRQLIGMSVSVINSDGKYLLDPARDSWADSDTSIKLHAVNIAATSDHYTYRWQIPLGFILPTGAYKLVVTVRQWPNLVFKKVLPVNILEEADANMLLNSVKYLASSELQGRAPGQDGGNMAAQFIANQFQAYGLRPGGMDGWYQPVKCYLFKLIYLNLRWVPVLAPNSPIPSENVIGIVPGRSKQAIIVSAHYDHLGVYDGATYYGANDNASGVSVLMEAARILAKEPPPQYTLIFAAWTGEEQGFLGSDCFASQYHGKVLAVLNVDSVGNNAGQLAAHSDNERLNEAIRDAAIRSGTKLINNPEQLMPGDAVSFSKRGIPAVDIYSPFWLRNNHTTRDDLTNVDAADLQKAAQFLLDLVGSLEEHQHN
ncbi:MAG: M28 family peptidase [Thermacetogeniaceae bacterium]